MSLSSSRLEIVAPVDEPSANVTLMWVASSTTWSAVRIWPAWLITTPLPRPSVGGVAAPGLGVSSGAVSISMSTSDGWMAAKTSSDRGGPGVCDARALATVSATWRWVMPGLAGNRAR